MKIARINSFLEELFAKIEPEVRRNWAFKNPFTDFLSEVDDLLVCKGKFSEFRRNDAEDEVKRLFDGLFLASFALSLSNTFSKCYKNNLIQSDWYIRFDASKFLVCIYNGDIDYQSPQDAEVYFWINTQYIEEYQARFPKILDLIQRVETDQLNCIELLNKFIEYPLAIEVTYEDCSINTWQLSVKYSILKLAGSIANHRSLNGKSSFDW